MTRHEAGVLALQRTAGNVAVVALLEAGDRASASAAGRASAAAPVVQRVNSFYSNQPRSSTKPNPLMAIAQALETDTGITQGALLRHWRESTSLQIAKTARRSLTSGSMATLARPDEASAWLDTPNPNPGTRKDPAWITAIGNLGTVEDQIKGDPPQQYNGGHLIAWEFLNAAANVQGNIAPQAMLQNQALFRRLERTLEEQASHGQGGLEVTVQTPYGADPYQVTYQQLFDRGVITDPTMRRQVTTAGALSKSVSLAQMAPDTYQVWALTRSGQARPATADKREARTGITTYPLTGYTDAVANKALAEFRPAPLSVLATNVDDTTREQTVFAFAHHVYLNYRTVVPEPRPDQPRETYEAKAERALRVIQDNPQLANPILDALTYEFDMAPTRAYQALVAALIATEPVEEGDAMDEGAMDEGDAMDEGNAMDVEQ